jgi:hypothetical protein
LTLEHSVPVLRENRDDTGFVPAAPPPPLPAGSVLTAACRYSCTIQGCGVCGNQGALATHMKEHDWMSASQSDITMFSVPAAATLEELQTALQAKLDKHKADLQARNAAAAAAAEAAEASAAAQPQVW